MINIKEEVRALIKRTILEELRVSVSTKTEYGFYGEKHQTIDISLYLGDELINTTQDYIE